MRNYEEYNMRLQRLSATRVKGTHCVRRKDGKPITSEDISFLQKYSYGQDHSVCASEDKTHAVVYWSADSGD
jgi:hypothetical protein